MAHVDVSDLMPKERIYTPAEVAKLLDVNAKTITRWERSGKLRGFKTIGGHRRYYQSQIDALLRSDVKV